MKCTTRGAGRSRTSYDYRRAAPFTSKSTSGDQGLHARLALNNCPDHRRVSVDRMSTPLDGDRRRSAFGTHRPLWAASKLVRLLGQCGLVRHEPQPREPPSTAKGLHRDIVEMATFVLSSPVPVSSHMVARSRYLNFKFFTSTTCPLAVCRFLDG
jgi:hypothetical protein